MKTIVSAVLSPPFIVKAPVGAKPLFVTVDSKGKLRVFLEVEDTNLLIDTHFYVIGTGHHVPDSAGAYIGTGIVSNGIAGDIILHVYAGERKFDVVKMEDLVNPETERKIGMSPALAMGYGSALEAIRADFNKSSETK